jgi:hypothetical protein
MGCDCDNNVNPNRCGNPCNVSETNTAACESLPSQIQNFSDAFFGTVIKTETNGIVSWSLPCGLDVGLPNNPRGDGEGLACYFLRLFADGIVGLTGPEGPTGNNGVDGHSAYTVLLAGFTQPTVGSPNVTVSVSANPAILEGLYVFIQSSGWYLVDSVSGGTLSLTLAKAVATPPATVTAGKLVVPAGFPGNSVVGPQGLQGTQGVPGTSGASFTATNGQYIAGIGTNYQLDIVYTAVNFVNSSPALLLPNRGTYLVTAIVDIKGLAGVDPADVVAMKLHNTTNASDVQASEHSVSHLAQDQFGQIVISTGVITDGDNQTLALYGKCTTANKVSVIALNTVLNYVRLS